MICIRILTYSLPTYHDYVAYGCHHPHFDSPDWRAYVCSHPQATFIIGLASIVRFEGRFLQAGEPNAHALNLPGPFGKYRFDFVAVCTLAPKRTRSPSWGGTSHG